MKKRIITLFALAMLFGGVSSSLMAQSIDSVALSTYYNGEVYERQDPSTTLSLRLTSIPAGLRTDTIELTYHGAAAYLGLPSTVYVTIPSATTDTVVNIEVKKAWNMPTNLNATSGSIEAKFRNTNAVKDTSYVFYKKPEFFIDFHPQTTQYKGKLNITVVGGNTDYMIRYIDNDTASYVTVENIKVPFTETEISNLNYYDKIIVDYLGEEYILPIPSVTDPQYPPGTILRPVTIPVVSGAVLSHDPGIHQTPSGENFTFFITPTGENANMTPVVSTGRTSIPDSEGVTYEKLENGSWLVTILRVQTSISLTIDFTTSNASIDNNKVWANGSQLNISATTSGNANVYSITGSLVRTIALNAGEAVNVNLPSGLYIVTVNGKAYKITAK